MTKVREEQGITPGHAYSLLEAATIVVEGEDVNAIKMQNPYNKNKQRGYLEKFTKGNLYGEDDKKKLKIYP